MSEAKRRRASRVYTGSPWSHSHPEAARMNCLPVVTSSCTPGPPPPPLPPPPPHHLAPRPSSNSRFPSARSLGDDGPSSFPCSCWSQTWSSDGIWQGSEWIQDLVCETLGNTGLDYQGFWAAGPDEHRAVSRSPLCLCIWVCIALRPEGLEAGWGWRLATGWSQEEPVAPVLYHELPHECAGLLLGFLSRPKRGQVTMLW